MNSTVKGHGATKLAYLTIAVGLSLGLAATMTPAQMRSSGDEQFASEASSGGMAEVQLGQLAEQKGTSADVKAFGKRMVTDHTKAGEDLKKVAHDQGMTLPTTISKEDQITYDRLAKLDGAQFDAAYAKAMLQDHKKDVAAFEKQSTSGSNDALKQFAARTLPTLKDHLKEAQDLAQSTSASTM
jgi:putative membrane protein